MLDGPLVASFHSSYFFFFNDTATTEIYTLSLHDALPILGTRAHGPGGDGATVRTAARPVNPERLGESRFGYMPSGRCKSRCAPTPNTPRFPPPFSLSLS